MEYSPQPPPQDQPPPEPRILFTSDHHFYHTNIIRYCGRPFVDTNVMNEYMVVEWNKVVRPIDTVWHLGDFCLGSIEQITGVFNRLNGHKHIVLGNHDRMQPRRYVEEVGFLSAQRSHRLKVDHYNVLLLHRPPSVLEMWPPGIHIQLAGHIHQLQGWWEKRSPRPRIYNICVEQTGYKPVTLEQILAGPSDKLAIDRVG